ncbi:acyltransferase [Microbulbifer celer]|uniref:Acyltransferase n=1 Tax=Microbulbifer celer TaxID=435905 RepID=A0ABW3U6P8_9GAMM|nr:acyltransferase [Microbulbifer celer]UFN57843.1 acyltransferase [Microbulbifer celer]
MNPTTSTSPNKESTFLQILRTASREDLALLTKLLMPHIAQHDLRQPRVWGDKSRLHLNQANFAINDLLVNTRSGHVTIERDCFFGHRCMLLTGTHDYRETGAKRLKAVPDAGRDIVVKRGVWMGSGVTVLGPAVIGENAVIAAGSVVRGDVAANTIVAGNPAAVVKTIDGQTP